MKSELKVGVFVVISIVVLAFFMVNTGDWQLWGQKNQTYEVLCRFSNVVGLTPGAGVGLSGVKIGEVADIRLEGNKALVVMAINDNVDFPSSSKARISSVGLLGQAAVEIIPTELEGAGLARDVGEIGSLDPVTIDQLVAVLSDIGDDATDLVGSIRDFLYGNEARIVNILENVRQFTMEVEQIAEENRNSLKGSMEAIQKLTEQMKSDLPGLLDDVKTITADLKKVISDHKDEIGSSVKQAEDLLKKLNEASSTLQKILDKVNEGDGTFGKLLNDSSTLDQANEVIGKADTILTDFNKIMKSPSGISFGYGFRAEYFNESEDFKYYYRLTTRFNEKDSMVVEIVNDNIYDKSPIWNPDQTVEDDNSGLDILGDDFSFTAMYGRAFPGGTVRVGLIEDTTGIALDLGSIQDRLNFTLEGYDFGRENGPHLKAYANLNITGGFHLTLGYDDPSDSEKSQWFFGGGFRF